MLHVYYKSFLRSVVIVFGFIRPGIGDNLDKFDECKVRIDSILNGSATYGEINNVTIESYIYRGKVHGMNKAYERTSRDSFLTITTEEQGCRVLCDDPIDWYWQTDRSLTLGIISNWVLPIIALTAALPYDSLHARNARTSWFDNRFWKTLGVLANWLGSPQTALTATLFNIHQLRKCFHETLPSSRSLAATEHLKRDAYYILCCLGQFKILKLDERFLETLVLGLFKPVYQIQDGTGNDADTQRIDEMRIEWTKELLMELAFQLRMLRRRGVYPTFLSILLFFVAYAVSLTSAFSSLGERTTAHSLAFGILISWFPLLVLFAIIDRNPVSADRSRKLIARWLWNVEATRRWANSVTDPNLSGRPWWWSQRREVEEELRTQVPAHQGSFDDYIGEFVGQGRQVGYNGLPYAIVQSIFDEPKGIQRTQLQEITKHIKQQLEGPRPPSWWMLSVVSQALVWLEIGMALLISVNIPTVGLGCRAASYLIYGGLSSLTWLVHLLPWFARPGTKRKALCHIISTLSTLTLFFITFAAFSGVFKNCLCRGGTRGYMDFEDSDFYRNPAHFDVAKYWWAGAIIGAFPIFGSLLAAWLLLSSLKPLWQASEQSTPVADVNVDTQWLI